MLTHSIFLFQDAAADEAMTTESLISVIMNSGVLGLVIVTILLILCILAVYIFFERYLNISRAQKVDQNFMNNIRMNVQQGNLHAARGLCQQTDTPVARMIEKGLMRIGKPLKDIDEAISNVGNLEVFKLEKNLANLASIAGAAPMIGFFGTVTGMISAFYEMSTQENITPDVLAGGIYQALLTTAFGLFVGILSFVGYNLLVSKVNKVMFKMEATAMEFVDLLQEPAN